MPGGPQQLDGPPPSPVTSPAAASNVSRLAMLTGGAAPGQGGPPGASGPPGPGGMPGSVRSSGQPDLSGVMALGQKISEAILSLASALPAQAGIFDQARELIENAVAQAMQGQAGAGGAMSGAPSGAATTQAGPQFPGGGFGAGRSS